jgi:O-methyltransferase
VDPKQATNRVLSRALGVELVKTGTVEVAKAAKRAEARDAADRRARAEAIRKAETQRPHKPSYPTDFDPEATGIISAVRAATLTSPEKLFALILAVRHVHATAVPGAIVECGVWRGGSMQAAARALSALGSYDRDLYLFDTFEGRPAPTDRDVRHDRRSARDLLAVADESHPLRARASLEDVEAGMAATNYPSERLRFVQGLVEQTVPARAPEQVSILRVHTDWYAGTRHVLEQLYPRLCPGGVLIVDGYADWQGAREATDEFIGTLPTKPLLLRMSTGRIAVKP